MNEVQRDITYTAHPSPIKARARIGRVEHQPVKADAMRIPLADQSVDLVVGSPPYMDARTYGIGAQRDCREWVSWMLDVTTEALRVSKGAVIWVVGGVTRDHNYWPGCEGLMWEWFERGGSMFRPVFWHRVGIPGSGGKQWFRADVEYCLCFKRPGPLPWADNVACGHVPKWAPGGKLSYRDENGMRRHHIRGTSGARSDGSTITYRASEGRLLDRAITEIANPGNWLSTNNGGGALGHPAAHESEAPYPVDVPAFFIRSLCPPGGIVYDPFVGSGTTIEAALKYGRHAIGSDIRAGKGALATAKRRIERPHAPVPRKDTPLPLFGERQ